MAKGIEASKKNITDFCPQAKCGGLSHFCSCCRKLRKSTGDGAVGYTLLQYFKL
jgi:hypothetical protein